MSYYTKAVSENLVVFKAREPIKCSECHFTIPRGRVAYKLPRTGEVVCCEGCSCVYFQGKALFPKIEKPQMLDFCVRKEF